MREKHLPKIVVNLFLFFVSQTWIAVFFSDSPIISGQSVPAATKGTNEGRSGVTIWPA